MDSNVIVLIIWVIGIFLWAFLFGYFGVDNTYVAASIIWPLFLFLGLIILPIFGVYLLGEIIKNNKASQ